MHMSVPLPHNLSVPLAHWSEARRRRSLAAGLVRLVAAAEQPRKRTLSATVPVQRQAILSSRALVLELADDLRAIDQPVNPKGVALVKELLCHGSSPAYSPLGDDALRNALRQARAALLLR
jgi:hypothetical protein